MVPLWYQIPEDIQLWAMVQCMNDILPMKLIDFIQATNDHLMLNQVGLHW